MWFRNLLIIFLIFAWVEQVCAKNIAVMLYTSEVSGNKFYHKHIEEFGFLRKMHTADKTKNFEYHITLGYINNIDDSDILELKNQVFNALSSLVNNIEFEFGVTALLGRDIPFIVALPSNSMDFINLNCHIEEVLKGFQNHKYSLNSFTEPNRYIPHLSLNAKVIANIKPSELSEVMTALNHRLYRTKLQLNKLVVKIED